MANMIAVEDLPMSMHQALPPLALEVYVEAYNMTISRVDDPIMAHKVAWTVVKNRFIERQGDWMVASEAFVAPKHFSFQLQPIEGHPIIVQNMVTGAIELDAVLATTEPRQDDGRFFTVEELLELAAQINEEGSTLPDVDHGVLMKLIQQYGSDHQRIIEELRKEKGILRNIKAAVKDGKLWIRAMLDKRYKNYLDQFTRLSIEAMGTPDKTGRIKKPRYLGFTFTNTPQLPGAAVAY